MNSKLLELETSLNSVLFEREDVIHTAILALIAKRTHLQLGEPGAAKSATVTQLVKRIEGLTPDDYFHYQLTPFTEMGELFGGVDLNLLKSSGITKRITTRKAPRARIIFYDELFRGGSAILNANLMLLNERQFLNHDDDPHVPLWSMFAASNTFPSDDDTAALRDRMDFRIRVEHLNSNEAKFKMLTSPLSEFPDHVIHVDDIVLAQKMVDQTVVSDEVLEGLMTLWMNLNIHNVHPTDRRWKNALTVIKAEAVMAGRDEAILRDLVPLQHCLWNKEGDYRKVRSHVLELVYPEENALIELYDKVNDLQQTFNSAVVESKDVAVRGNLCVELVRKVDAARRDLELLESKLSASNNVSKLPVKIRTRIREIARQAVAMGDDFENA